ncbi:hypothetical protein [Taibaiella koreensis]|uniref:hypothetical protein n=1 Tax=Taibaiella koreensis TaxID=1268548 RepID=UPI0013C2F096|nr:hypothetical protein [Taibaiella koreensis]
MKNKISKSAGFIAAVLAIGFIIGSFVYLSIKEKQTNKQFYKMEIKAIVIKRSDWQKRSIDFYLNNGTHLNFIAPATGKLEIGDSVHKARQTFNYSVFRKNVDGVYAIAGNYNYMKIE